MRFSSSVSIESVRQYVFNADLVNVNSAKRARKSGCGTFRWIGNDKRLFTDSLSLAWLVVPGLHFSDYRVYQALDRIII
jgi:hypothetical protein